MAEDEEELEATSSDYETSVTTAKGAAANRKTAKKEYPAEAARGSEKNKQYKSAVGRRATGKPGKDEMKKILAKQKEDEDSSEDPSDYDPVVQTTKKYPDPVSFRFIRAGITRFARVARRWCWAG